jgi:hypothetical protein
LALCFAAFLAISFPLVEFEFQTPAKRIDTLGAEYEDRRDEIRFETKIDRRKNPDRRLMNAFWDLFRRR